MNDVCDCCEGSQQLTPILIANRPGLAALVYRLGTHAAFLETMKAKLSSFYLDVKVDELDAHGRRKITRVYPLLRALTTRATDDLSIALLDAWALLADVLTFYQERIANESYLRTATERRSVLELARLVGYTLRPGVASTVYLAYTLDNTTKEPVIIPIGARVQSAPGPGELPQSFETVEKFETRAAWNILKPRTTKPQTRETIENVSGDHELSPQPRVYLKGIGTNLKQNDPLLVDFADGTQILYRVIEAKPDAVADRTLVKLQSWSGAARGQPALPGPEAITAKTKSELNTIVVRYLYHEPDKIGLSRFSQTFKRVSNELGILHDRLQEDISFRAMLDHLENETLSKLEPERQTAETKRYTDLQPWLESMIAELRSAAAQARLLRAEALAREFTPTGLSSLSADMSKPKPFTPMIGDIATRDALKDLLPELAKQPSIPPRNTLVLRRDIRTAFSTKADTNVQVAGTFRADTRELLPVALANTKVTRNIAIKVYALRVKASPFGYNAQKRLRIPASGEEATVVGEWPIITDSIDHETSSVIHLDASYDKILPDSWIVIDSSAWQSSASPKPQVEPAQQQPLIIKVNVAQAGIARAEYGLSGKTTRIELDGPWLTIDKQTPLYGRAYSDPQPIYDLDFRVIRSTAVYAQSEELALAEEPIEDSICGSDDPTFPSAFIELDSVYSDLQPGRWLIISGERTDIQSPDPDDREKQVPLAGIKSSELVMLAEVIQRVSEGEQLNQANDSYSYAPQSVRGEKIHTYIRFNNKLQYCYKRDTVVIYGNVVKATHGETRNEVLGSGDGSQEFQSFGLKQPPLTYVAAPNPAGAESTLHVRVNDIEWPEADSLASLGPTNRNYITRADDASKTTVIFGNGHAGARPPTGVENIKAAYRSGIGKVGNVKAEQIRLLATRPLGVKEVINPLRASGGADKESRDQARKNAPLAVLALDRLVSIQDYADFARTFAGIDKASVARLSNGQRQLVHLTIAGADDIPIDKSSDLYRNLVKALHENGDPYQPILVELRELIVILISANISILPNYQWESVVVNIRAQLLAAFSFERRELGQDVLLSQVISVMHSVEGVAYVDVDTLGGVSENDDTGALRTPEEIAGDVQQMIAKSERQGPAQRVKVNMAQTIKGAIRPAQLAFLTPNVEATLVLKEVKS